MLFPMTPREIILNASIGLAVPDDTREYRQFCLPRPELTSSCKRPKWGRIHFDHNYLGVVVWVSETAIPEAVCEGLAYPFHPENQAEFCAKAGMVNAYPAVWLYACEHAGFFIE